jgi:spore coat polysaccharide biosynthesis protein SpsF
MHPKVVCLIQARMDSSRLPGKVMKSIKGKPLIWYITSSLKKSKFIDTLAVITSNSSSNSKLTNFLKNEDILFFIGSEDNVLERYYLAAKNFDAELIVRITGDCPLIDYKIVDSVIQKAIETKCDYASNVNERSFPRGYDTEVFTMEILQYMFENTNDPDDLEHVTLFIRKNLDKYKTKEISTSQKHDNWRLCVDTLEDFELIKTILESVDNDDLPLDYQNIQEIFQKNPSWPLFNCEIHQKPVKGKTY